MNNVLNTDEMKKLLEKLEEFIPIVVHINPVFFRKHIEPNMQRDRDITGILRGTGTPYILDNEVWTYEFRRKFPLKMEDIVVGKTYGSPLAKIRWTVNRVTDEIFYLVEEGYPANNIICEKERFLMWVNGDERHNKY